MKQNSGQLRRWQWLLLLLLLLIFAAVTELLLFQERERREGRVICRAFFQTRFVGQPTHNDNPPDMTCALSLSDRHGRG